MMVVRKCKDLMMFAALLLLSPFVRAETQADINVLRSIEQNDIQNFKSYLADGYDVNGFVEGRAQNWLMCDVTQPGRIEFLKHAIIVGGDVNRIRPEISQSYAAPLMCAISYGSKQAFDYLLQQGANPNIVVCSECELRYQMLPLREALFSREFQMAFELVGKTAMTPLELDTIRYSVEDTRYLRDPVESQEVYRLKLAEFLESKGFELNVWTLEKENAGEWLPTSLREEK